MERFIEILTIFGFIFSIGLFGYGLKKIFIKVEIDKSKE
tara:strand:+ start:468 stop:584 length:117 start_codon:yes stop_codon:yes gene_type:complete